MELVRHDKNIGDTLFRMADGREFWRNDMPSYLRDEADDLLAAEQSVQRDGAAPCDHKSTVGLGGYCSECGLPKPPRP